MATREIVNISSSPSVLSSPPSAMSEPGSPTRYINRGRANIETDGDEMVVDPTAAARFGLAQPPAADVPLTLAGLPRKKPGRKPGAAAKPKVPGPGPGVAPAADGSSTNTEAPKQRRPRKPRDPNAPPIQRKRKAAPSDNDAVGGPNENTGLGASASASASAGPNASTRADIEPRSSSGPSAGPSGRQPKITELTSMRIAMDMDPPRPSPAAADQPHQPFAPKMAKREANPGSMQNLLNDDDDDPPSPQQMFHHHQLKTSTPSGSTRQIFDPVRSNYDPVRETMVARDPYGTNASSMGSLASPRAPSQVANRASASPSIASLVDPPVATMISPSPTQQSFHNAAPSRFQESTSMPPSPSQPPPQRAVPHAPVKTTVFETEFKPTIVEAKRPPPLPTTTSTSKAAPPTSKAAPPTSKAAPPISKPAESTRTSFTVVSNNKVAAPPASVAPMQSKKVAAVAQKEKQQRQNASTASSSPKVTSVKDALPAIPAGSERSILDFGRAGPGEEPVAPSIVLHIPLNGETNKYVNFMRMAEERYGWDALHPRQAAHRERQARIAAASAALERNGSGRESGDEMSVDLQSDGEGSNVEMGGIGNGGTSGADGAPAKPARRKRNHKEDEYDKDDDFVDDSELLWETQAAASRDGFFVYSGPLVPEVETPPAGSEAPPRRGRGGRGRGGTTRGAREGSGRGRGGGPGSRGGVGTRKPRITKLEKQQLEREKAEREKMAQMTSKSGAGFSLLQTSPTQPLAAGGPMEE